MFCPELQQNVYSYIRYGTCGSRIAVCMHWALHASTPRLLLYHARMWHCLLYVFRTNAVPWNDVPARWLGWPDAGLPLLGNSLQGNEGPPQDSRVLWAGLLDPLYNMSVISMYGEGVHRASNHRHVLWLLLDHESYFGLMWSNHLHSLPPTQWWCKCNLWLPDELPTAFETALLVLYNCIFHVWCEALVSSIGSTDL